MSQRDLALAHTPGVAEPCRGIHNHSDLAYRYSTEEHLVAVVTNRTTAPAAASSSRPARTSSSTTFAGTCPWTTSSR